MANQESKELEIIILEHGHTFIVDDDGRHWQIPLETGNKIQSLKDELEAAKIAIKLQRGWLNEEAQSQTKELREGIPKLVNKYMMPEDRKGEKKFWQELEQLLNK